MATARSDFVGRIDSQLESQGKVRKDLIVAADLNHNSLSSWDIRGNVPTADIALRVADYLGVPIRWLITGEDEAGYSLEERNVVVKYRCLTEQGRYEINALLEAKLKVQKKEENMPLAETAVRAEMESPEPLYVVKDEGVADYIADPAPSYGERIIDITKYAPKREESVRFTGWDIIVLPFMGKVAAGVPIEIGGFTGEGVPFPKQLLKGNWLDYFVVEISGTSMTEVGINDGEYVLLKKAYEPKHNKIMLVRHEGDSTLKRIKIRETKNGREVELCWEDGSGKSVVVDDDDYQIQGEYHMKMSE